MKDQKHTRPPYDRMTRIHVEIHSGELPNCTGLGGTLEVSPKTIQRDIAFMRDRLGLPIVYDHEARGYRYTETVDHFPTVAVTEGEVFALFVAQKVMAQYKGTPFEKLLTQSFEKLAVGLEESVDMPLFELGDAISFKSSGTATIDLDLFRELHRAIVGRREVRFQYKRRGSKESEERSVQPYFIHGALNAWYLIGFDKARAEFRVYALQRMHDLHPAKERFERQAAISSEALLKNSLGVYIGDETYEVRIRFDAFSAELIRERRWHDSQQLTDLPDEKVELTMTLNSLFEVEQWILGWGSHAEVLAPPELRERVAEHARAMRKLYRN